MGVAGCAAPHYGDLPSDAASRVAETPFDGGRRSFDATAADGQPAGESETSVPSSADATLGGGSCGPEGTQILHITSDVAWDPASLNLLGIPVETVHGGTGSVSIIALSSATRTADGWQGTLRPCWGGVPDFTAFDRKFGVFIPDESIESIPRTWTANMHATCRDVGCVVTSDELTVQLGIELAPGAPWPDRGAPLDPAILVDEEGDGKPGITAHVRGPDDPGGYSYVTLPNLEQVDRLYLALRMSSDLLGHITSCDVTEGTGSHPGLSMRAIGCRIVGGTRDCTADEVETANDNFPDFRVPSFKWHSQRAPDGTTCSQARQLSGVMDDSSSP